MKTVTALSTHLARAAIGHMIIAADAPAVISAAVARLIELTRTNKLHWAEVSGGDIYAARLKDVFVSIVLDQDGGEDHYFEVHYPVSDPATPEFDFKSISPEACPAIHDLLAVVQSSSLVDSRSVYNTMDRDSVFTYIAQVQA